MEQRRQWNVSKARTKKKIIIIINKGISTRTSHVVPHRSTTRARGSLTSQIGRDVVLSAWYGRFRTSDAPGRHCTCTNPQATKARRRATASRPTRRRSDPLPFPFAPWKVAVTPPPSHAHHAGLRLCVAFRSSSRGLEGAREPEWVKRGGVRCGGSFEACRHKSLEQRKILSRS